MLTKIKYFTVKMKCPLSHINGYYMHRNVCACIYGTLVGNVSRLSDVYSYSIGLHFKFNEEIAV